MNVATDDARLRTGWTYALLVGTIGAVRLFDRLTNRKMASRA
jgi:hypothetical protein